MIGVYFDGRLGNQLFQYAFARKLKQLRGEKDDFVFNFGFVVNAGSVEEHFEDNLQYFKIEPYVVFSGELERRYCNLHQRFTLDLMKLLCRAKHTDLHHLKKKGYYHQLDRLGIVISREDETDQSFEVPFTGSVVTMGRFMIPTYYNDIKAILQKEFEPKQPILNVNKGLYQQICTTQSVCVHIRRGDYLSDAFKKDFFVCDEEYFRRAISLMSEKVNNPTFVFFSDDVDWVKATFHIEAPCMYERSDDPSWEALRLMYSCKHFIISNSTFSWWAQYLCRNENKIVISPNRWFANPEWKSYLIQEDFIKIDV